MWLKSIFFVELTANKHNADGEDLLRVGVWGDVAEADAGQTTEGEVQSCDIFISNGRTRPDDGVIVRRPELLTQIVQPANPSRGRPLHVTYGVPGVRRHVKCSFYTHFESSRILLVFQHKVFFRKWETNNLCYYCM